MKSFVDICEDTKEKLGRKLNEKEKEFLKWMYEQQENEDVTGKSLSMYANIKREKKLHC